MFDAPRELVFKAWTDPKQVAQWWGPHGFSNPVCELGLRPGADIRIHMRGPDGTVYPMTGVYRAKWQNETNYAGARYKDDGPGRPVYCWDGAGLDSEPGAPRRIPGKDLTAEERKCPAACTTEAVRIRTKRPRIAQYGGLRQRGALRNTLMEKSLD